MTQERTVPPDFPRGDPRGAVAGAQPKLLVRIEGDQYVAGLTDEELQERYEMCADLVRQLVPYAQRKRLHAGDAQKLKNGLKAKDWGLTIQEIDWVVGKVAATLGWPPAQSARQTDSPQRGR